MHRRVTKFCLEKKSRWFLETSTETFSRLSGDSPIETFSRLPSRLFRDSHRDFFETFYRYVRDFFETPIDTFSRLPSRFFETFYRYVRNFFETPIGTSIETFSSVFRGFFFFLPNAHNRVIKFRDFFGEAIFLTNAHKRATKFCLEKKSRWFLETFSRLLLKVER